MRNIIDIHWGVRLSEAVEQYKYNVEYEISLRSLGVAPVKREIDNFRQSLNRTTSPKTIFRRLAALSEPAKVFINMFLKRMNKDLSLLHLMSKEEVTALMLSVKQAKNWLREKPGKDHGYPIRQLVRDVALIYEISHGKTPGFSSAEANYGSGYTTKFEHMLQYVFVKAGVNITLEGLRNLGRSELNGKLDRKN